MFAQFMNDLAATDKVEQTPFKNSLFGAECETSAPVPYTDHRVSGGGSARVAMSRRLWTVAFLSVPFLACTTIVVVPLRSSLYYSFTDRNGFNARCHWIGLENFLRTPRDILLANTVMDTAIWMAAATVVPTGGRLAMVIFLPGLTLGAAKG